MADGRAGAAKAEGPRLTVDPSRSALVVVDMQNDYCHPDGVFAHHGVKLEDFEGLVERIVAVIQAARRAKVPIVHARWVIMENSNGEPAGAGLYFRARPFLATEGLRRGTWGAQALDVVGPCDFDIEKTRFSAYHNTPLSGLLRGLGVETVIIIGVYTNHCVEATARDTWSFDMTPVLVRDATAAMSQEMHEAALKVMAALGPVVSTDDVVEALG